MEKASYVFKHKIDFKTPAQKWNDFEGKEITNFIESGEAESGNAGEQPARINLTNGDDAERDIKPATSYPGKESSLFQIP